MVFRILMWRSCPTGRRIGGGRKSERPGLCTRGRFGSRGHADYHRFGRNQFFAGDVRKRTSGHGDGASLADLNAGEIDGGAGLLSMFDGHRN